MQTLIDIFNFIAQNYQAIISAVVGLLTALIGVFMLIPGSQPESTLQKILDFITKFSRKPAA